MFEAEGITTSEIIEIYNTVARDYTSVFFNPETLQAELHYLEEFVSYIPFGGRVLDVGCGPGIEANFFENKSVRYEGIDLSSKMIAIAKERNPTAVFRILDMQKLDYKENEFDGVMALESLIHFPKSQVECIINNFRRILRNKGTLLLALQEGNGEQMLPFPFQPNKNVLLNLYYESELRELLSRIGFKVMSIHIRQALTSEFPFNKLIAIGKKL